MAESHSEHKTDERWWKNPKEVITFIGAMTVLGGVIVAGFYYGNSSDEKRTVAAQETPNVDRAQREQALKDQLTVDGFPAIDKINFGEPHASPASTQVSVDIGIGACILRNVEATAEIDATGGVRDVHNYRFSFTTEPAVAYPFENADDLPGVFHDQDPCKAVLDHTPVAVLR